MIQKAYVHPLTKHDVYLLAFARLTAVGMKFRLACNILVSACLCLHVQTSELNRAASLNFLRAYKRSSRVEKSFLPKLHLDESVAPRRNLPLQEKNENIPREKNSKLCVKEGLACCKIFNPVYYLNVLKMRKKIQFSQITMVRSQDTIKVAPFAFLFH